MTLKLERIMEITPAFDGRSDGHGIRGCDLIMRVAGKTGSVYFSLSTNWQTPQVRKSMVNEFLKEEHNGKCHDEFDISVRFLPSSNEIGYHSPIPLQEGQPYTRLNCVHFPGRTPCYCDASPLNAVPVFDILVTKGSEAVWEFLEEYYMKKFGEIEESI